MAGRLQSSTIAARLHTSSGAATSISTRCWTMCVANSCALRRSAGVASAARRTRIAPANAAAARLVAILGRSLRKPVA
jgi:hypothetical protein